MPIIEEIEKITVHYRLPAETGALLWMEFDWIPPLETYLGAVEGAEVVSVRGGYDGETDIRVDFAYNEDPEVGITDERSRELVRDRLKNLIADIDNFYVNIGEDDLESGHLVPVFATRGVVISHDRKADVYALHWLQERQTRKVEIDRDSWIIDYLRDEISSFGVHQVVRHDTRVDEWAQKKIRQAVQEMPGLSR